MEMMLKIIPILLALIIVSGIGYAILLRDKHVAAVRELATRRNLKIYAFLIKNVEARTHGLELFDHGELDLVPQPTRSTGGGRDSGPDIAQSESRSRATIPALVGVRDGGRLHLFDHPTPQHYDGFGGVVPTVFRTAVLWDELAAALPAFRVRPPAPARPEESGHAMGGALEGAAFGMNVGGVVGAVVGGVVGGVAGTLAARPRGGSARVVVDVGDAEFSARHVVEAAKDQDPAAIVAVLTPEVRERIARDDLTLESDGKRVAWSYADRVPRERWETCLDDAQALLGLLRRASRG